MLIEQTIEKLMEMHLRTMASLFRNQINDPAMKGLSFEDRFGLLVDQQWTERKNNNIARLIKNATFKFPNACVEDIQYHPDRKLEKNQILQLAAGNYIKSKNNIIIMGASGAGKSYLGCSFGVSACRQHVRTKYIRLPELLEDLNIAHGEGSYKKVLTAYTSYPLLIFDEWMLRPLTDSQTADLFEIVEARYNVASTIFIAQSSPKGWYQLISEGRIADAILDRIVHNAHEIPISGELSMRERLGLNE